MDKEKFNKASIIERQIRNNEYIVKELEELNKISQKAFSWLFQLKIKNGKLIIQTPTLELNDEGINNAILKMYLDKHYSKIGELKEQFDKV